MEAIDVLCVLAAQTTQLVATLNEQYIDVIVCGHFAGTLSSNSIQHALSVTHS
jgi:hypothetical protein